MFLDVDHLAIFQKHRPKELRSWAVLLRAEGTGPAGWRAGNGELLDFRSLPCEYLGSDDLTHQEAGEMITNEERD